MTVQDWDDLTTKETGAGVENMCKVVQQIFSLPIHKYFIIKSKRSGSRFAYSTAGPSTPGGMRVVCAAGDRDMKKGLIAAAFLIFALGSASLARADQFFFTNAGAVDTAGDPVAATANFSLSGTTLTLTLKDLQGGVGSAGQLLTGLSFTLSSGGAALNSQMGDLITIASDGSVTDLGTQSLGWGFGGLNGGFELCVICQGGISALATPSEGIIGPTPYPTTKDSISGNGPHNPFVNQVATFTFTIAPGVTISNVQFSFGTQAGDTISAPEPASVSLLAAGLLGLGFKLRRRSKRS